MKKINKFKGIIGILLSLCMIIQMMSSKYSVQAAEDQYWLTYSDSVYTSTAGTVTDNRDGSVTLNTKAAAYYKEKITVKEGTEISFNVTIPTVVDGYDVVYGFALTDNVDSYYRSSTASGYSVAAEFLGGKTADKLVAMGSVSKSGTRTVLTAQNQVTSGRADIVNKTYTVTYTKQESTSEYSWIMTVTEQGGTTATLNIKASDFAHDQLGDEVYLIVGSAASGAHEAKISNLTIKQPSWSTYSDSVYTSTAGTVTDNGDGSVTLNTKAAAYYKEKITVKEGTKISFDVKIPTVVSDKDLVYGFALTDNVDSYYRSTEASGYSVAAEFLGGKTADKLVAMGSVSKSGTRTVLTTQNQVTSGRADIVNKTYTVTYTKQESTSEYSWIMTVTEQGGTTATLNIKASDFAHDQLGDEVYLIVGSAASGAHVATISNLTIKQPASGETDTGSGDETGTGSGDETGTGSGNENSSVEEPVSWNTYSDSVYTSTAGTVTDNGDGSVTLKAKATAYCEEPITVKAGTEISFNVTIPTVVSGMDLVYGFALTDDVDSYYRSTEASGYAVAAELLAQKTTDKMVAMGSVSKDGTRTVLTPQKLVTSGREDIVNKTYTVTITRQASTSEYSWIMTVTEQGGTMATMQIKASDFAHDQLGDELYLMVGSAASAAHEAIISNLTVKQSASGGDITSPSTGQSYIQTDVIAYILSETAVVALMVSIIIFVKKIKRREEV